MEVTDQADYKKLIGDFLTQLKVRNQTLVIILSDEIIFQKQVSSSDLSAEEEKFFDEVPFDPENLDRFEYKGKSAYLFASNRQLYQPIVESAKLLNSRTEAVLPASLLGNLSKDLTQAEVNSILSKIDTVIQNLKINGEIVSPSKKEAAVDASNAPEEQTGTSRKKMYIVIGVLFFLILAGAVYLKLPFLSIFVPGPTQTISEPIVEESTTSAGVNLEPTDQAIPTPQLIDAELRIQVLNGTGSPGQAGRVQEVLEPLGYKDFTLGNASSAAVDTIVQYSGQVSSYDQEVIGDEIGKFFENVVVRDMPKGLQYDVIITTGNYQ